MKGQITQGPLPGPSPVGHPETALTFPTSLTTKTDGTVELTLTATDPGNPRGYIDGQVYGITYASGSTAPPLGTVQDNSLMLSALVFSGYQASANPTWLRDVQPIFQQYADLYPVMKPFIDLGDFGAVARMRKLLRNVFAAPITDANAMPVTRDLSAAKRAMLLAWLDRPRYMHIETAEDLQAALQVAIELEHSTIPPYLTAYYSIKPGANAEVAQLIYSVVIEEMFHMSQVCNLMIAIGGRPRIGHPRFVPRFPGPLPGGLRSGLTVRLRRCSIEQVRDVFMSIEEPHLALEAIKGTVGPDDPVDPSGQTIAWFYAKLRASIIRLAREGKIQFGNTGQQLAGWPGSEGKAETKDLDLKVVGDLDGAVAAIDAITEQGAGIDPTTPTPSLGELAALLQVRRDRLRAADRPHPDRFQLRRREDPVRPPRRLPDDGRPRPRQAPDGLAGLHPLQPVRPDLSGPAQGARPDLRRRAGRHRRGDRDDVLARRDGAAAHADPRDPPRRHDRRHHRRALVPAPLYRLITAIRPARRPGARVGDFHAAVKWQMKANVNEPHEQDKANGEARLALYRAKKPYHDDRSWWVGTVDSRRRHCAARHRQVRGSAAGVGVIGCLWEAL